MIALLALPMECHWEIAGCSHFQKNAVSKFKRLGRHHCHLFSAHRIPHLPKKLAPVRAAVASILLPQDHISRLYSAADIANALNFAADVDGNNPQLPFLSRSADNRVLRTSYRFVTIGIAQKLLLSTIRRQP